MTPPAGPRPERRALGFTLIEALIAIAIVALLASIALPAYQDSVRKGRRSEAFNALAALQQAQERYRSQNPSYAATLAALAASSPTPTGLYSLAVSVDDATKTTRYVVTATAVAGTSQAGDAQCAKLGVKVQGGNILYAGCGSCSLADSDYAASNACWAR